MASDKTWQEWLRRLYNLKRDHRGIHEPPHKAVFLLSVLDLFDRGILCHNQVPFSSELVKTFQRYFEVVAQEDDSASIEDPFYHLSADGFWQVLSKVGNHPIYIPGKGARPPAARVLRESFGRFDEELWAAIVTYAKSRRLLREALISRYFPAHRDALNSLVGKNSTSEEPPGREEAFRHIILQIYDYACAACGTRVKLDDHTSLVGAAHLIPFEMNRSDRPDNGLALCPNHLWALDQFLIAPCPDGKHEAGIWHTRKGLDAVARQGDLADLEGQPVAPPNEEKFLPALEGLQWREKRLLENR